MAVYEGKDKKGRTDHSFEIISNLQAAEYFKRSTDRNERHDLAPVADTNGYPLKYLLKTGSMVLFYENTPAELYECTRKELVKRLYKVTAMAAEGRVQFLFHQEARDQKNAYRPIWSWGFSILPIQSITEIAPQRFQF